MFTRITPMLHKSHKPATWFLVLVFAILSVYPIYRNFYYSNGLKTYERHIALLEGRSEFYNPWQYRILSPYLVEGVMWIYNHTIDKVYPIEQKLQFNIESTSGTNEETAQFVELMRTPGAMKYMVVFILFRFMQHFLIFYLVWRFWQMYVHNRWLILTGICFLALAFGNAVNAADLSFNTYTDISLYLIAALIILKKRNPLWLLPVTVMAAFNRETGMLIPALYFITNTRFTDFKLSNPFKTIGFPKLPVWLLTAALYVIFLSIFFALRMHFGYREQQTWKVEAGLPMLQLNLFSAVGMKAYLELIGTFAVIPLIILYTFKRYPHQLKVWFLFMVPLWFAVHFVSVVAYQTRLFMVPMILIMMPMLLWLIEQSIRAEALTPSPQTEIT
ncbi:MAG TPA: hypothetical protein PKY29_05010 [Ferruginibacter sp.]|nr:hypothetical protein [Ferruginibacter sp.]HRO18343.1 hypothetical protein [Ferruginibacter sp.]HRQ20651.1 hypothetical protein [Ferruginibacter sp.]